MERIYPTFVVVAARAVSLRRPAGEDLEFGDQSVADDELRGENIDVFP